MRYRNGNFPAYSSSVTYTHYTAGDITVETYVIPFDVEAFSGRCWEHDAEGGSVEPGRAILTDFIYDDGETTRTYADLSPGQRRVIEDRFQYELEHDRALADKVVEACAEEPVPYDGPDY